METFFKDLLHSARSLRTAPVFTATIIGSLAIGIAACTALFSVVNAVLLKPLAFSEAERVVMFQNVFDGGGHGGTASPTEFNWWREQKGTFEEVAAYSLESANLVVQAESEVIQVERISGNFFNLSGTSPLHGRTLSRGDDIVGAPPVVVLAYGFWRRRFGSDPLAIGRRLSLNGVTHEVVGIMRPEFAEGQIAETVLGNGDVEAGGGTPDLYLPIRIDPNSADHGHFFNVIGRLTTGVSLAAANAHLRTSYAEYARKWPNDFPGRIGFRLQPIAEAIVGGVRKPLLILLAAVSFVLLIACVNAAGLLMSRAAARRREMATRLALGASRGRIVRQLLTESLLLSVAGGLLGLALGYTVIRAVLDFGTGNIPRIGTAGSQVNLDWRVFAFTLGVTMLTAILFGLFPAVQASRGDGLNVRGRGELPQYRARALMVTAQIALSLVLLTGAALLIRTVVALNNVNPGFDWQGILTMRTTFADPSFRNPADVGRAMHEGLRRVRLLPAVHAAAITCCLPLEDRFGRTFRIVGRPEGDAGSRGGAAWTVVSTDFFAALGIRALRGRVFTNHDEHSGLGVIVINQALAKRFWPDGDPLSGLIIIGREAPRRVIGIVNDIRDKFLRQEPVPTMYVLPTVESGLALPIAWAWVVRTRSVENGVPADLRLAIQNELRIATGGLPIGRVLTMDQIKRNSIGTEKFNMLVLSLFASSGLFLAAIGIYGFMALSVARRRQEIGIRLALGAEPRDIRNEVMLQGLRVALGGLIVGSLAAFGLTRIMAGFLYGVEAADSFVFFSTPMILLGVAIVAVWIPALRASRIDPIQSLRHE